MFSWQRGSKGSFRQFEAGILGAKLMKPSVMKHRMRELTELARSGNGNPPINDNHRLLALLCETSPDAAPATATGCHPWLLATNLPQPGSDGWDGPCWPSLIQRLACDAWKERSVTPNFLPPASSLPMLWPSLPGSGARFSTG